MITVNGEPLNSDMVNETFDRIKADAEARYQVSCCERNDEFIAQAEEEVIDSILIAQDAEDHFPQMPEDEIRTQLEALIKEYRKHGASWEMLEAQRDGMRQQIIADLRMTAYMDDLLKDVPAITEEDLQKVYVDHRDSVAKPPRARSLHMCFFPHNHADLNALMAHANYVRSLALKGEDFAQIAEKYTEKNDKEFDLGWIDLEDPLHPFESMLFSLEVDEISPVLSYDQALHLVKVVETEGAHIPSFEEIREEIVQMAERNRRRDTLSARATLMREKAEIVRHEDQPAEVEA